MKTIFNTIFNWLLGKGIAIISPLQKVSIGLSIAFWGGFLTFFIGCLALFLYPLTWYGETIFDVLGTAFAFIGGLSAFASYKITDFSDEKVEQIRDYSSEKVRKTISSFRKKEESLEIEEENKT